jgi:pimeloyl-ACP methyl ester carboxylesterase
LSPILFERRPPAWFVRRYLLGDDAPEALREAFFSAVNSVSPTVLRCRLNEVLRINVQVELASLRIPVLYMQPARDRLLGEEGFRTIQQHAADLHRVVVDAPHLMLQREPEECVRIIDAFMKERF